MQYSTLIRKKDNSYQYVITYKVNGKWKTKSKQGYPLNREGKEFAKKDMDKAVDLLKEQLKNNIDEDMIGITFKQFTEKFKKHIELYREMNTVLSYNTVLNWFSELDNKEMSKISNLDIQEIVDKMVKAKIKSKTINDYLLKLKTIFRSAKEDHHIISEIPLKNIQFNKVKAESTKRALNKKELDNLLKDFKEDKKHNKYYLVLLIASTCGLRLGEILGLRWIDIDFKKSEMHVAEQWKQLQQKKDENGHKYDFGNLKSKNSNRIVPIPETTLSELELLYNQLIEKIESKKLNTVVSMNELKKIKNTDTINERIFKFDNVDSVSICVNRLLKGKGYDITVHELRHTYATMLISSGVDFKTAAKLLGHDVIQTMKTYSHVNDDMMKKATSIIENIF